MFWSQGEIRIHRDRWLVLHACKDLGKYYRSIYNYQNRFAGMPIRDSVWGPHISVCRGEEYENEIFWNILHTKQVDFWYEPIFKTEGKHVWFKANSPAIPFIREGLGLEPIPKYNFHLTVGLWYKPTPEDERELQLGRD